MLPGSFVFFKCRFLFCYRFQDFKLKCLLFVLLGSKVAPTLFRSYDDFPAFSGEEKPQVPILSNKETSKQQTCILEIWMHICHIFMTSGFQLYFI